ncbi:MAG: hydroxyacid dehydrogenase [Alcanivorax sp.]|nr:hydroxyacid dehydrogenase [Alcanivorax sp.]
MGNQHNKILVTHRVHQEVADRLRDIGQVDMNPDSEPWPYEEICRRAADASAMMGFMTDRVDMAFLNGAPRLKIIACALKGYDSYDVSACKEAGVWLSIVPDLLTEPTAELAIGLCIGLGRHIRQGDHRIRTGSYQGWRPQLYGYGLHGANVAVVGLGAVGRAILARLQGFGCRRLLGVDPDTAVPGVESVPLAHAQRHADILFLAAPLTPSSIHMLDAQTLPQSQSGQMIINIGRGSVVNEYAIADALHQGRLGGYAADVFSFEDWALPDRPLDIPDALLQAPNTLFTPHLGSAVHSVRLAIEHRAADNIIDALQGRPPRDLLGNMLPVMRAANTH